LYFAFLPQQTLTGNPFRRCVVFSRPWYAHIVAYFTGRDISEKVIQLLLDNHKTDVRII